MSSPEPEIVEVLLGSHGRTPPELFGPLPGRRLGNVVAYEMQAPDSFVPWPGGSRLERTYVLLDLGVSLGVPCWARHRRTDGTTFEIPPAQQHTWYVDLVTVDRDGSGRYVVRDLFVDVMIGEGLTPRMLDLDELADAYDHGWITTEELTDGLRRWQRFLDRHLHRSRFPEAGFTDFPPTAIRPLADIPDVFGPPVTWPDPPT